MEVRKINQSYDDTEETKRCRYCGYKVTEEEKEERGRVNLLLGSERHSVEYHSCVFCPSLPWYMNVDGSQVEVSLKTKIARFFSAEHRVSSQIHKLKKAIRDVVFESPQFKRLTARKNLLEQDFHDQVFKVPYRSDDSGNKILNSHQVEHERVSEELRDLEQVPRMAYYDSLGKLGVSSDDEAPATRKLNLRQKKILSKLLQQKLAQLEAYRASGFYD